MKQNFKKISEAKLRGKKKKNKLINRLTSILVAFENDKMKGKSRQPSRTNSWRKTTAKRCSHTTYRIF